MNPISQYRLFTNGSLTLEELQSILKSSADYHYDKGQPLLESVERTIDNLIDDGKMEFIEESYQQIVSLCIWLLTNHWDECMKFIDE